MELEKEISYFLKIQNELRAKYLNGGFAVIFDENLLGVWSSRDDAIKEGIKKYGNVSILVKNINDNLHPMINFSRNIKLTNAFPDQ